ncbi:hypothetical protein RRG08_063370 [Elysia crispata]|uniref:Uncharacterized protein n=1 Tax=Elysia crispata TaxID=231223 RepID=A0AAE1E8L3_9GAST|nr:hypothetical protein RRG08_063370 [Elysia crispata]
MLLNLSPSADCANPDSHDEGHKCKRSGWFGKDCHYRCHCLLGPTVCDSATGECNGPCTPGWFGPGCQYVISSVQGDDQELAWLVNNDSEKMTCNQARYQNLDVLLRTPHPFTWLTGTLKQSAAVKCPSLLLTDEASNSVQCQQFFSVGPGAKHFHIVCETHLPVKKISLQGELVPQLCSLLISAGRDVSLQEKASEIFIDKAPRVIDNGRDSSCSDCKAPEHNVNLYIYLLKFLVPVSVQRSVVHKYCNSQTTEWGQEFEMDVFMNGSHVINRFQPNNLSLSFAQFVPGQQRDATSVEMIGVRRKNLWEGPVVCKLEVFGDYWCKAGVYGPRCAMTCNCSGINQVCHVATGLCLSPCIRSKKVSSGLDPSQKKFSSYLGAAVGVFIFLVTATGVAFFITASSKVAARSRRPAKPRPRKPEEFDFQLRLKESVTPSSTEIIGRFVDAITPEEGARGYSPPSSLMKMSMLPNIQKLISTRKGQDAVLERKTLAL